MKRLIPLLATSVLSLLVGCHREKEVPAPQIEFAEVPVQLLLEGEDPDTRSLIDISAESFRRALLVAFGSDGRVMTHEDGHQPVAIETSSKSFEWALPVGTAMDIYVLVNYSSLSGLGITLDGDLKRSDLDNLVYHCGSESAFQAMGGTNMPMTGIVHTTISSYQDELSVTVRRLFARYDLSFDASAFRTAGYTLTAGYMKAMNCSASVPYFIQDGGGYKVTAGPDGKPRNVVESMDRLTEGQLEAIFDTSLPAERRTATLYILENCQGNLGQASSWDHVYQELGEEALSCATYVEVRLKAAKSGQPDEEFIYRIYLGKTDQKSNFDIRRNCYKQLNLALRPIIPVTAGERPGASPFDGFRFIYDHALVEQSGKYIEIPFETNLKREEVDASIPTADKDYLEKPENEPLVTEFHQNASRVTRFAYSGMLRLYAPEKSTNALDRYVTVTGGVPGDPVRSDETVVHIRHTRWITIDLTHDWESGEYVFTASEPLPCRVDMKVYIGTSPSPEYMFLGEGTTTASYHMVHEDNKEVFWLELYKLAFKTVPPYTYTTENTEYHFILSIEGNNQEDQP